MIHEQEIKKLSIALLEPMDNPVLLKKMEVQAPIHTKVAIIIHLPADGMYGLPFDGCIDWEITMKNIAATGYAGPTAIEAVYWDYKDLTAM